MADAADSKSAWGNPVGVRIPSPALLPSVRGSAPQNQPALLELLPVDLAARETLLED